LKVDFGFSPYSERINGRVMILMLSALLLVELAMGKSVINYHTLTIYRTNLDIFYCGDCGYVCEI